MQDPTSLYEFDGSIDPRTTRARNLVVTLTSFMDAGHAQTQFDEHILSTLTHHHLARFDLDQLVDYRGQRPTMIFDHDHFAEYSPGRLVLRQVLDESGVPFLLLSGPEPDLQWERLAKAIEQLVDQFDVQSTVILGAMPMGVPHTRPVSVTRFASDPSLLVGNQPFFQKVQLPASFPTMLAYRLGETGHTVFGLSAHVPHYLAQSDYPDATIALTRALSEVTGLTIPMTALAVSAGISRAQITEEISHSDEAQQLVTALEEQYDAAHESRPRRSLSTSTDEVPTADDIAREAEEFLRGLNGMDGKDGGEPPEARPF